MRPAGAGPQSAKGIWWAPRVARRSGRASAGPNRVERSLIERKQPARSYPEIFSDFVQPDGGPRVLPVADARGPISQRSDLRALSCQDIMAMHPEGACGSVTTSDEVVEDLIHSAIGTRDWTRARHSPCDARVKQRSQRVIVAAAVERVLCLMKPIENRYSGNPIHW